MTLEVDRPREARHACVVGEELALVLEQRRVRGPAAQAARDRPEVELVHVVVDVAPGLHQVVVGGRPRAVEGEDLARVRVGVGVRVSGWAACCGTGGGGEEEGRRGGGEEAGKKTSSITPQSHMLVPKKVAYPALRKSSKMSWLQPG